MLLTAITLNMKVIDIKTKFYLLMIDYLDMIRQYLSDIKNDHKAQGE